MRVSVACVSVLCAWSLGVALAAEPDPGALTVVPAGTAATGTAQAAAAAAPDAARVGSTFRERLRSGGEGPEMVVIPAGRFRMGCLSNDRSCWDEELPVREVTITRPFALSVYEVTFEDFDRLTYPNRINDEGWGRGRRPATNVSWKDAQHYVAWLSQETGAEYRLPTEAEWEYAARAGTTTQYSWGNDIGVNRGNCKDCGSPWEEQTAPVGSFAPNGFGLYDMHGNLWEWVADCWNQSYAGGPTDGSAWRQGLCLEHVLRGGSWSNTPPFVRTALRLRISDHTLYEDDIGLRVARTLTP